MLTLIVSRRIYSLVKNSTANPKKMARYTQLRWSKIFAQKAADLLTVILHRCGIQRTFETTMSAAIPVLNKNICGRRLNFLIFRNDFISLST